MSWSIGYDVQWNRDIGHGVPSHCDHPGCGAGINRGLTHVCGGEPYGGERGCGLYFCGKHQSIDAKQLCERCLASDPPFTPTPEHPDWIKFKLCDESWREWRDEHPEFVVAHLQPQ